MTETDTPEMSETESTEKTQMMTNAMFADGALAGLAFLWLSVGRVNESQ